MAEADNLSHDVRMRGFARRHTVDAALAWLDAQVRPLEAEHVRLSQTAGRVLAATIVSPVDVPGFDRSTMDGYAVVADDTESATPYNRIALRVVGDALPASPFMGTVDAWHDGARHDGRAAAGRLRCGAPCRVGRARRGTAGAPSKPRPPCRQENTSAGGARTSRPARL